MGVGLQARAEIRHQTCRILPGRDSKLVRGDPRLGGEDQRWIDDMEQGDLGMKGARQILPTSAARAAIESSSMAISTFWMLILPSECALRPSMHHQDRPIAILEKMSRAAAKNRSSRSAMAIRPHHDLSGITFGNRLLKPDFDRSIVARQPSGLSVDPVPLKPLCQIIYSLGRTAMAVVRAQEQNPGVAFKMGIAMARARAASGVSFQHTTDVSMSEICILISDELSCVRPKKDYKFRT